MNEVITEKAYFKKIESTSGWEIAREFNLSYDGDMNPIEQGGFFYDSSTWDAFGYVSCLEFWEDCENDVLVVSEGTINKPDDMTGAFRCYGIDPTSEDARNIHAQISSVRSYCGIEYESTAFPCHRSYRLEDWKEWRIWKSVAPLLKGLRY